LVCGGYSAEMHSILGSLLPKFSPKEKNLIKGNLDFIGINNYGTLYAKDCSLSACPLRAGRPIRGFVKTIGIRNDNRMAPPSGSHFILQNDNWMASPSGSHFEKNVNWMRGVIRLSFANVNQMGCHPVVILFYK